jgi:sulfoxide reductase heme-binding subunit YedZ
VKTPARWLPVLAASAIAGGGALAWTDWDAARWIGASRASGWVAAALLLGSLAATPLGAAGDREAVKRWRRALGISAALAAIVHLAIGLAGPLWDSLAALWSWPTYRAGTLATAILTLLLATSFPPVVRKLRLRVWKPLHRLAYVAGALVLLHLLRLPFAPLVGVLLFGSALLLLLLWRGGLWLRGRRVSEGARRASR